jgi:hypothetical protein
MKGRRMTRLHSMRLRRVLLAGAMLCAGAGAADAGPSGFNIGLHASDCLVPGVIAWYSGNALAGGMGYNACPNPIPLPTTTAPAPTPAPVVTAPTPAAEEPAPAAEEPSPAASTPTQVDASPSSEPSSPVADVTPSPPPPPPPPQRIPVAVPTYTPWIATTGPGSTSVGGGNGTANYMNAYNALAPTARAATNRADWCNRNGRSQGATSACINSVNAR